MKTKTTSSEGKFLHFLFTAAFLFLCITQSYSQKRDFKEAQIFISSRVPEQLLTNRGFSPFEPLEQPDENYPTIMIDVDKTFQTIEGLLILTGKLLWLFSILKILKTYFSYGWMGKQ